MENHLFVQAMLLSYLAADGKGEGFGNAISIQTVAIVLAAKATGRVYSVDSGQPVYDFLPLLNPTTVAFRLYRADFEHRYGQCATFLIKQTSIWNYYGKSYLGRIQAAGNRAII